MKRRRIVSAPHATKHVKIRLQLHLGHPGPQAEPQPLLPSEEHPLASIALYKRELSGTSPRNHVTKCQQNPGWGWR